MAVTTYAELVTALDGSTGYLHRSDLTAKIPDFIRLCEADLASDLRLLLAETETTITASIGSRLMAVPTRFGTPLALWCTTYSPRAELTFNDTLDMPVTESNGPSSYYTVDGAYIATENPADSAYTYTLRYLPKWDIATTSTNTVLTNWPGCYVYGTLLASIPYTRDMSQQGLWQSEYNKSIAKAMRDTLRTKGKAALRCDDHFIGQRANINRGG